MSKVYASKIIPEHTERYVRTRKCDICGMETVGIGWKTESLYDVNDTKIRVEITQKTGTIYPECGFGTEYEIDLCPTCFKKKLIPWLKSQGADINEEEWNW